MVNNLVNYSETEGECRVLIKKLNLGESHQGVEIISLFILSKVFAPYPSKDIEIKAMAFLSTIMLASLITLIVLVRRNANNERLFERRPTLNKFQQIIVALLALAFVYEYVVIGNFQSFLLLFSSKLNVVLDCFMIAAGAALSEEYFLRGYLFNLGQRILSYFGFTRNLLLINILMTSFIFGALHLINLTALPATAVYEQVLYAFIGGLFFCAIRIVTNRIYTAVIFHFVFDFTQGLVEGLGSLSVLDFFVYFAPSALLSVIFLLSVNSEGNHGKLAFLKP